MGPFPAFWLPPGPFFLALGKAMCLASCRHRRWPRQSVHVSVSAYAVPHAGALAFHSNASRGQLAALEGSANGLGDVCPSGGLAVGITVAVQHGEFRAHIAAIASSSRMRGDKQAVAQGGGTSLERRIWSSETALTCVDA